MIRTEIFKNKKIQHLILIVAVIIMTLLVILKNSANEPEEISSFVSISDFETQGVDSDSDGFPDWLEDLFETDPKNKFSFPESESIEESKLTPIQSLFGEDASSHLEKIIETETFTDEDLDYLSEEILISLSNQLEKEFSALKQFSFNVVDVNTPKALDVFLKDFFSALDPLIRADKTEASILTSFINKQTTASDLQNLVLRYESVINSLLLIDVPKFSSGTYLLLLNQLEQVRFALDEFAKSPDSALASIRLSLVLKANIFPHEGVTVNSILLTILGIISEVEENIEV